MIERGEDFAVCRRITETTNAAGDRVLRTNLFTVLDNAMNYLENGVWQESKDMIEPFPGGAVARHGPHKAIFNANLNADSVFDVLDADGTRLQGGPRAILISNAETGDSVLVAVVKESAPGEILTPDRVVYRDAFDGLAADVVYVWRHNYFSQTVILREKPSPPTEWNPKTTRLEVLTEFIDAPVPALVRGTIDVSDKLSLDDHVIIAFPRRVFLQGKAFSTSDGMIAEMAGDNAIESEMINVGKNWQILDDRSDILVESVNWIDIQSILRDLPSMDQANLPKQDRGTARAMAQTWPHRSGRSSQGDTAPMQFASAPYHLSGVAIDFEAPPTSPPYTFKTGVTYSIANSFYCGQTVTFEPGCVVKYQNNAYALVYGALSFPTTLQTPVFTSFNDDSFGEDVDGTPGSTPTQSANPALWLYYYNYGVTVQNARIRWAKQGIRSDTNPGTSPTHYIRDSVLEQCQTGVYLNMPGGSVSIVNTKKHAVATPIGGSGSYSGTISDLLFYTDKSFKGIDATFDDDPLPVPDTMGAAGPTHVVELLNGKIVIFEKSTGRRLESLFIDEFFRLATEPRQTFDPRIAYDAASQRWIACAADKQTQNVMLSVSTGNNPLGLRSNWRRYELPVAVVGELSDFPTLGYDANGIYIVVLHYVSGTPPQLRRHTAVAIKKPEIYSNNLQYTKLGNLPTDLNAWYIQPAVNFDTPQGGFAWLVAKAPPVQQGGVRTAGRVYYRKIAWSNGVASWSGSWVQLVGDQYLGYFDLEYDPQGAAVGAPQRGTSTKINLRSVGSGLTTAMIRGGFLYTCQDIGLDGIDGDYDGQASGSDVDRSGAQWLKLQVQSGGTGLTYNTHGRIFDAASTNPYWYYMSSSAVNSAGDMLVGFSGSRGTSALGTEYIGAFYAGRGWDGVLSGAPALIAAGRGSSSTVNRWGDYSKTCLDPDGVTFWTVQQYMELEGNEPPVWGTWITSVRKGP